MTPQILKEKQQRAVVSESVNEKAAAIENKWALFGQHPTSSGKDFRNPRRWVAAEGNPGT
jgi:hypothetical protein